MHYSGIRGANIHRRAHFLVKEFHEVRRAFFWADLLATAFTGWSCFAAACRISPDSPWMWLSAVAAMAALYRGLCFLHEIVHVRPGALPGFEFVWNLLFGLPLLMPSFIYTGVHQSHHSLLTFGTRDDPEYMPFAGDRPRILVFAANSVLLPLGLAVRYLVLSPPALLLPRLHRVLEVHASSLAMNLGYRRQVSPGMRAKMYRWETALLLFWGVALANLPVRVFVTWFAVDAMISLVNTLRTLGAHHYTSKGEPVSRDEQLLDSIDTPGALWTELWAPVGLRYHALHHYFPGIPYHNLGAAYRRLQAELPEYLDSTSRSLPSSLATLYQYERPAAKAAAAN